MSLLLQGELGTVLFLHGFPEIWYSWRHQMLAVAAAGYRAVALDWRGYGLSDQPPEPEAASYDDLVEDLLAILDALSIPKVALPIIWITVSIPLSGLGWGKIFLVGIGSVWWVLLASQIRNTTISKVVNTTPSPSSGHDGYNRGRTF